MFSLSKNPLFKKAQDALCSQKTKTCALMLLALPTLIGCAATVHQDRTVFTGKSAGVSYKVYPTSHSMNYTIKGTDSTNKYDGEEFNHTITFLADQIEGKRGNIPGKIKTDVIINNKLGSLTAKFSVNQKTDAIDLTNVTIKGDGVILSNIEINKDGSLVSRVSLAGNRRYSPPVRVYYQTKEIQNDRDTVVKAIIRNNKHQIIAALRLPKELISKAMVGVTKILGSYDDQHKVSQGQNGQFSYEVSVNHQTPGKAPSYGTSAVLHHPTFEGGMFDNNIRIYNGAHNWETFFEVTKNNLEIAGVDVNSLKLGQQKALDDKLNNLAEAITYFQMAETQKATGGSDSIRFGVKIYDNKFLSSQKGQPKDPKANLIAALNDFPDGFLIKRTNTPRSYYSGKNLDYKKGEGRFAPIKAIKKAGNGILKGLSSPSF